jgi:hypothetical protein
LTTDSPSLNLASIRRGCLEADLTLDNAAHAIARPEPVLATGCTGFVEAFIVHHLLKHGIKVYCLVHAESASHARQRIMDTLIGYDMWNVQSVV